MTNINHTPSHTDRPFLLIENFCSTSTQNFVILANHVIMCDYYYDVIIAIYAMAISVIPYFFFSFRIFSHVNGKNIVSLFGLYIYNTHLRHP